VGILLTPGMRPSYRLDISVGELRFANTRGSVGGMRYGRYEDKGRGNKIQVSAVQRKGLRFGTRGEAVYEYGSREDMNRNSQRRAQRSGILRRGYRCFALEQLSSNQPPTGQRNQRETARTHRTGSSSRSPGLAGYCCLGTTRPCW
jgi:hypothetical protein